MKGRRVVPLDLEGCTRAFWGALLKDPPGDTGNMLRGTFGGYNLRGTSLHPLEHEGLLQAPAAVPCFCLPR